MDWPWTAIQSLTSSPGGNLTTSLRSMPELREALACLWRLNFSVPLSKRFFGRNVCKCKRIYIYIWISASYLGNTLPQKYRKGSCETQNDRSQIKHTKTCTQRHIYFRCLQPLTIYWPIVSEKMYHGIFLSKTFCLQWDNSWKQETE